MLEAYLDESGIHSGAMILSVGGAMAAAERWRLLEKQWLEILGRFEIDRFHATDCANSRKEFTGWDKTRRDAFMNKIISCVASPGILCMSSSVVLDGFEEVIRGELLESRVGHPYHLCLEFCIQKTFERQKEFWPKEKVAVFVAPQREFRSRAEVLFSNYENIPPYSDHLESVTYAEAEDAVVPLQVADLVAYEAGKCLFNRLRDPDRAPRKSFDRLWQEGSVDASFYDRESLERLAHMIKEREG